VIAEPMSHSRLLEMIVETAAQVISAEAASLFLIDQESQELIFEVALGQKADEVKHFRVPLGHGIGAYSIDEGFGAPTWLQIVLIVVGVLATIAMFRLLPAGIRAASKQPAGATDGAD